ncbi:hypothetical protein H5410_052352 [Solanum commersonii]|uniref:Uncharacterized protein n=1 Tax=Solanum commersonii TaxID=4109 RepID=A0A9J5X2S3_SOLCO|nr:hypothetical protein H5410_052352 [Solanum commersonii]
MLKWTGFSSSSSPPPLLLSQVMPPLEPKFLVQLLVFFVEDIDMLYYVFAYFGYFDSALMSLKCSTARTSLLIHVGFKQSLETIKVQRDRKKKSSLHNSEKRK